MSAWHCEDCLSEVIGKVRRGRCDRCYRKHLKRLRETGADVAKLAPTVTQRILRRTTPGWGGCIIYTGHVNPGGYAVAKIGRRSVGAHRQIYLQFVGEIADGMVLDHMCHSSDASCPGGNGCIHRRCVNPFHLEPVTQAENNMRSGSVTARNRLKRECKRGHAFTPENTRLRKRLRADGTPCRECRECARIARQKNAR